MKAELSPPNSVHLVGSMALPSVDAVFEATGSILGRRLKRVPDGEPGGRNLWITWQYPLLRANPFLQADEDPQQLSSAGLKRVRLAEGVTPDELQFSELGYAREARTSYVDFVRARDKGLLDKGSRFQVCLPTPFAVVLPFVTRSSLFDVERAYEAAMIREVEKICAEIPHRDLAIQWDLCIEMVMWDGQYDRFKSPFADAEKEIIDRVVRICRPVPADVELGFHLCYGDWDAKHFVEPSDAGAMVGLANALVDAIDHPIAFLHLPVPIGRTDDTFFAPLEGLRIKPGTELYLGVVHAADGVDGTNRRIAAARKFAPTFGVSTECGLGRCKKPDTVLEILHVHAGVSTEPK
jgi:hypothetical protein